MYQTGDQVVYSVHGVCRVAGLEKQIENRKTVTYLVLEPVGQKGSSYLVPTSSEAAMSKVRPMLNLQQLESLLRSEEIRIDNWIQEENLRKQTYRALIASGNRMELLRMVYTLFHHKKAQLDAGKKVHLADDNFLRDAEKLLVSEIAVVMDMQPEEARAYLRKRLNAV